MWQSHADGARMNEWKPARAGANTTRTWVSFRARLPRQLARKRFNSLRGHVPRATACDVIHQHL